MEWERWRFVFVYLFSASDFLAAGLIGGMLWRRRNGGTGLLGLAFIGVSIRGFGELVGACFGWEQPPVPSVGNAISYWGSRVICAAMLWIFLHYILWSKVKKNTQVTVEEKQIEPKQ